MGGSLGSTRGQGDPLVGGAMSDRISKLLERVARDVAQVAQSSREDCYGPAKEVLKYLLGPLLHAGELCAAEVHEMNLMTGYGNKPRNPEMTVEAEKAYQAALATLEGRDGK